MELQFSEIIELAVGIVVAPLLISVTGRLKAHAGWSYLLGGYGMFLAADFFTIVEGVGGTLGEWFNLLEHTCFFGMGALMAVAMWHIKRDALTAARRAL